MIESTSIGLTRMSNAATSNAAARKQVTGKIFQG